MIDADTTGKAESGL